MRDYSLLQQLVLRAAEHRLRDEPWLFGLCVDRLGDDTAIDCRGFHDAIDAIVEDTRHHIAPRPLHLVRSRA